MSTEDIIQKWKLISFIFVVERGNRQKNSTLTSTVKNSPSRRKSKQWFVISNVGLLQLSSSYLKASSYRTSTSYELYTLEDSLLQHLTFPFLVYILLLFLGLFLLLHTFSRCLVLKNQKREACACHKDNRCAGPSILYENNTDRLGEHTRARFFHKTTEGTQSIESLSSIERYPTQIKWDISFVCMLPAPQCKRHAVDRNVRLFDSGLPRAILSGHVMSLPLASVVLLFCLYLWRV